MLAHALREEIRLEAVDRCIRFKGWGMVEYNNIEDIWYVLYCLSNYRVDGVNFARAESSKDDVPQWERQLYYTLVNICNKSHKHYGEGGRGRFV